jgi:hypothetical protein
MFFTYNNVVLYNIFIQRLSFEHDSLHLNYCIFYHQSGQLVAKKKAEHEAINYHKSEN